MKKNMIKGLCLALAMSVLSGCGNASDSYKGIAATATAPSNDAYYAAGEAYYDADYEEYYMETESYNGASTSAAGSSSVSVSESDSASQKNNRKLIRNVDMEIETKTFEDTVASIQAKVKELGGYIEDMNTYNGSSYKDSRQIRNSSMVCRVPKEKTDEFLSMVGETSSVIRSSESMKDVTLSYVDLESHKNALLAEQERLLSLMERADYIEEIITIESRLSDIRYQIESMESQLRSYDSKVDYSTVSLTIREVEDYTPVITEKPTVWERISTGFMDSLSSVGNGFLEFFIGVLIRIPQMLVWGIFLLIGFGIFKGVRKSIRKKKEKKYGVPATDTTQESDKQ